MNWDFIFEINSESEFNEAAIKVFRYQYDHVRVYRDFVNYLNVKVNSLEHYSNIPFLPIEFFKSKIIVTENKKPGLFFESSGTTSSQVSKHYIVNEKMYQTSLRKGFSEFIDDPKDCIFLALLPAYSEREHSSLIYMVNDLMSISRDEHNGYFLYNHEELNAMIQSLADSRKKIILFGVAFALLDFIDQFSINQPNLSIIETGGMKGRKEEITKKEVLEKLQSSFPASDIYSEYGMTELLSQSYAKNSLHYACPQWMKVLLRQQDDPLSWVQNKETGALNIIDLANVNSCSFIATQDVGRYNENGQFEVLGRLDNSDIRGCSLMLSDV